MYGNALYEEGILLKAAEQYHLTLSYYEYCFPDCNEKQAHLDELRNACLCNISLCYYRMKEMRKAIACASKVLAKHPQHVKALYRRAKAHLALDEYDRALEDLTQALSCAPTDKLIMNEMERLRKQKRVRRCKLRDSGADYDFSRHILRFNSRYPSPLSTRRATLLP